jgi:hypothetical protein
VREAEIDGPWCQSVSQEVVVLVHATTLKGSRVAPPESDVTLLPLTTPLMKNSNPAGRSGGLANRYYYFYLPFLPLAPTQNINFPASCFVYPGWSILFFSVLYVVVVHGAHLPANDFRHPRMQSHPPLCSPKGCARRGLGSFSDVCPLWLSEKSRFSCNFGFQSS